MDAKTIKKPSKNSMRKKSRFFEAQPGTPGAPVSPTNTYKSTRHIRPLKKDTYREPHSGLDTLACLTRLGRLRARSGYILGPGSHRACRQKRHTRTGYWADVGRILSSGTPFSRPWNPFSTIGDNCSILFAWLFMAAILHAFCIVVALLFTCLEPRFLL